MLNEHFKAGKIHAFGGSNWTKERLVAANVYAPGGDVSLGIGGTFTGAFVGEHVLVWQGATIEAASVL